ncbi:hypothetical protein [Parabacteroides sp.]
MKIDYRKLAQAVRWGFCVAFGALALIALAYVIAGYTHQLLLVAMNGTMSYTIAKNW